MLLHSIYSLDLSIYAYCKRVRIMWKLLKLIIVVTAVNGVPINQLCGKNEEFRHQSCEPTCNRVHDQPCSVVEKYDGCFCKTDFIRDEKNKCIPVGECSKKMCNMPNEELNLNGDLRFCNGSGTYYTTKFKFDVIKICFCKDGYAKKHDACVPIKECT
ncbi:inducible metalloproteinase inhibitor protein-like isoform X4 [Centruroides sculpturatus]|nr:inducible metalloproteinase inhibitor protein-like isoform X3 [Centruroides sculpturatus]XP_023217142.1 inducible metalloproteinase inhibitor protein-like isoform X4 [Centruroides sculpturatus]